MAMFGPSNCAQSLNEKKVMAMPTASRIFGGAILAAIFYFASIVFIDAYRPGMVFFEFNVGAAIMGLWGGWVVLGKRVGHGFPSSIGAGVLATFAATFWGLFVFSVTNMFLRTKTFRFTDVEAAFFYVVDQFILYWKTIFTSETIFYMIIGAVLAGLLAEVAKKIWD